MRTMSNEDKAKDARKWSSRSVVTWSKILVLIALIIGVLGWYFDVKVALIGSAILVVVTIFSISGVLVSYAIQASQDNDNGDETRSR